MAIARDLSGNAANAMLSGNGVDQPWNTINRKNAGTPNAVLTPQFIGEVVEDSTNHLLYIAKGLTSSDWVQGFPDVGAFS